MAIDFRNPSKHLPAVDHAPEAQDDQRAVAVFPMHWWVAILIVAIAVVIGNAVVRVALSEGEDAGSLAILFGGFALLALLCWLPNSIRIDADGVHQVHFLGLWERSIARNDVRSFRVATRGELRQDGLMRFQLSWNIRQRGDSEEVVWVGSRSSRKSLLHSALHRHRNKFIQELNARGYPEYGYEGWEAFMEDRGIPVKRERE